MFTGIVQDIGRIESIEPRGGDVRLAIACERLDLASTRPGDSIAVSGVCLTAITVSESGFAADASRETLGLTTLGGLEPGSGVNLEPALRVGDALGGHLVSGHVDGVGSVVSREDDARSVRFVFEAPAALARYIARKGSITVDGVSLTVNEVDGSRFGVNIVPHTLDATIIHGYAPGSRVNLEVDLIARYLERLVGGQ
jgi:riboflavin synthase